MYNTGETVFYKLYLMSGNEWSSTSKNVYVNWYDNNGNYIIVQNNEITNNYDNVSITEKNETIPHYLMMFKN